MYVGCGCGTCGWVCECVAVWVGASYEIVFHFFRILDYKILYTQQSSIKLCVCCHIGKTDGENKNEEKIGKNKEREREFFLLF